MEVLKNYRPDEIEFTAQSNNVPKVLGEFETAEEAQEFMSKNLLVINTKCQAQRKMDAYEIDSVRKIYQMELEENLPETKENLTQKIEEFERAKQIKKEAEEMYQAKLNEIEQLGIEAKEGLTQIELDPDYTWQLTYNGQIFIYALMDGKIQLADVQDMAEYQEEDLITSSDKNAKFFEKQKASNE